MPTSRVAFALLLSLLAGSADAVTIGIDYSVSIRGFRVGSARIDVEVSDRRYSIAFTGGVRGIARFFSDVKTTAKVSGKVATDRLEPATYAHVWTEDNEVETVAMRFDGRGVNDIALDPPRRRPERYVPLTEGMRANAIDPLSAFLWPTSKFGPDLCDRTLPLIDGKRRFDIEASFSRIERVDVPGMSEQEIVVCGFRYIPVAGHRIDKKNDATIFDSGDAEVWLAKVADGMAAPVRVQFRSRSGRIVMRATKIRAD